jgi:type 2 lantibiotic biosynthesis protein LanM
LTGGYFDFDAMMRAAASLPERIALGAYSRDAPYDEQKAAARLSAWLENSSQGSVSKFNKRLSWWALDEVAAKLILGSDPIALHPPPFWASTLRVLLEDLETSPRCGGISLDDKLDRTPFAAAFLPLAAFGMRRLRQRVSEVLVAPLGPVLEVDLLRRIAAVCDLALGEEYLRFRIERGYQPQSAPSQPPQREMYLAFVSELDRGGLAGLFRKYPVLARLAAIAIAFWVDDIADFLLRLHKDLPEIERRFFANKPLPALKKIQSALSDPHKGGRTVKIAEFEDGRKIVYKPKSLDIDQAWFQLCAWLRDRDNQLDLRAPVVWNCGDHGWAEYIDHHACDSLDAVRRFYRRGGMLTALFYVTHASDFHLENLIAAGEHPVPIDLETLFVPDVNALKGESGLMARRYLGTVLQSLMLPAWQFSADQKLAYDFSGLGSYKADLEAGSVLGWSYPNTDDMQLGLVRNESMASRNVPFTASGVGDARDFFPEIVAGFRQMYHSLLRYREALLAPASPLEAFRGCAARIVLRPTRVYAALLRRSLTPRLLLNGIDRSLEFEGLYRTLAAQWEEFGGRGILRAELDALEQLDIPCFEAETGSKVLRSSEKSVSHGLLVSASFEAVVARIRGLTEADLEYQSELIEASFHARDSARPPAVVRCPEVAAEPLSSAELIERAEALAAFIARRTIWDGDAAYWLGLEFAARSEKHSLQPVGASLYSGRGGIAVFFAALHALTHWDDYRHLALGAVRSIIHQSLSPDADPETARTIVTAQGIGGASGIGSVVYSLLAAARLLGEPALIADAQRYAEFISEREITGDIALDVIGGASGAILSLLPLWRETHSPEILRHIEACAGHLVEHQQSHNGQNGGWRTIVDRPLAGFSHGAAGIAYALFQAFTATGDTRCSDAAQRGLEFERSLFLADRNNWRDARNFETSLDALPMAAWCHGAPGIGLARLGSLAHDRLCHMQAEIDAAIVCVQNYPMSSSDHLCCGEFGKIEFLLVAGQRLARPDLIREAEQRAASVIARAEKLSSSGRAGFHSQVGPLEHPFIPGLFNGLAGIGYEMLRLAAPKQIPCVLLWE